MRFGVDSIILASRAITPIKNPNGHRSSENAGYESEIQRRRAGSVFYQGEIAGGVSSSLRPQVSGSQALHLLGVRKQPTRHGFRESGAAR